MGESIRCPTCGAATHVNRDGSVRLHDDHNVRGAARCTASGSPIGRAVVLARTFARHMIDFGLTGPAPSLRMHLHHSRDALYALRRWEREHADRVRLHADDAKAYAEALATWERWAAMDDVVTRFLTPDGPRFECLNARVEDALLLLPDGCADLVDGDPPYGTGQWQRAESGAGRDPRAVHTTESWDRWDPAWIPEALRVARGPVTVCSPNGRVEELLRLGREAGVATRLHLWVKPDPRPRFQGQPAYGFEPVVVYRSNLQQGGEADYTIASAPREGRDHDAEGHPHQKPADLLRRLVRQSTPPGGLVVSLFAGSGTTAEASLLEGRRVLAVEADPAWCERLTARAHRALERLRREPVLPLPAQAQLPPEAA